MKYPVLALSIVLMGPCALADTRFALEDMDDQTVTVFNVRDGKVAFEQDGMLVAIYDSQNGSITQVDHNSKSYMVMDAAAMDEMATQMSAMMKQMEAQLANMPPEQREAMMQMMPGMGDRMKGDKAKKSVTVDWTGEKSKVAGYPCKMAKVTTGDGDVSKACIAKASTLGMPDEDYDAITAMFQSMQDMAERFGEAPQMPDAKAMGGIPIRMTDSDGKTSQLKTFSTDDLDGVLFEVPASYQQRSMTDGM